jgi:biofilm PGA synthesis protein PgaD
MRAERPIVASPEKQSLTQHLTSGTLGGVAWAIWIHLWMPIVSVLLWLAGLRVTYVYVVQAPNKSSLLLILVLVLVCNIIVSSWASYNYLRFVGKTRRRGSSVVSHEEVGQSFGVTDSATLSLLLNERSLHLHFDATGRLIDVVPAKTESGLKAPVESMQ